MKNRVLHLSCVLCLVSCIFSCRYNTEYQTINAHNEFTITLPSWMKEEETLAPGAPFQYANRFRNFYAVGFVTKKDTAQLGFDLATKKNLAAIKNSLTAPLLTDSVAIEINGMKGIRAEILGKMDGENIFFSEVMLESDTKIYHLSVWVRGEERKLRFKEDINKIIGSVKNL